MTTYKARALTPEHIRLIVNPHAPFLAAVIDTMPSYSLTAENIDAEATKASKWVSETPAIINAVVAAGSDLALSEVRDMGFFRRMLIFADVFNLTERAIGIHGMGAAVMAEIVPLSMHHSGVRH